MNNIYKPQDFLDSIYYKSYSEIVRKLLKLIIQKVIEAKVEFAVKARKDGSITFSLHEKSQKNIATIWIYEKHLRIIILNQYDKKIYTEDEVTDELIINILNKYQSLSKAKRQISVYLEEELIEKIEEKAKEENKKMNDIIVEAIQEKTREVFINDQHKLEFGKLIKSAGLYEPNKDCTPLMDDKKRKVIALFYLISAFQDEYYERFGEKFWFDEKEKALKGPVYLMQDWELGFAEEIVLGLGMFLLKGKESSIDLAQILCYLEESTTFFLAVNALKIVGGQLTLCKDEIVKAKPLVVKQSVDLFDFL
ncbi:MAG TPA: ribbon-helix-helix protein, CopG family [Acetivibrio sp.]|uniref:ribbon-helix-helix protein, CopG family n=1 Tax=Acetivibrio sp. TaxID=1872092 RepID=UPI002C71C447|nr:ribbon-helix-helix protein, CopG family [Acetivibrio sp.]HOM01838.1 ribbon-helix-helix protein, CopG family [Acetivibrio sp.]